MTPIRVSHDRTSSVSQTATPLMVYMGESLDAPDGAKGVFDQADKSGNFDSCNYVSQQNAVSGLASKLQNETDMQF